MSISSVTSKIIYVGTGLTGASNRVFPYPFRILATGDLTVTRYYEATGSTSVLTLNTDYAVSGAGESAGGNVTLTGSYTSLPSGSKLVIAREMDLLQQVDYVENDVFSAETHERALDRLTMITQQLKEFIDRSLAKDITKSGGLIFPEAEGDKLIAWNISADGLKNVTNPAVQTSASALAAASSATVAVNEATAASSSATVAVAQADISVSSATVAVAQGAIAVSSATVSVAQATAAGSSATVAVASQVASASSATVAVNAQSSASTSQVAAASSATVAVNSQTAAASSGTVAVNAQAAASSSATVSLNAQSSASASQVAAASSATVAVNEAQVSVLHNGTRPLSGNWDVGTFNITSVKTFGATTVTASTLGVSGTSNFVTVVATLLSTANLNVPTITTSTVNVSGTSNFITLISTLLSSNSLDVSLTANITTVRATSLTASILRISGTSNFVTVVATLLSSDSLNIGGIIDFSGQSGARAYRVTTNQSITTDTLTKIQFNGESYDNQNEFDSTTNYRFTATKAGIYQVMATVVLDVIAVGKVFYLYIYKNGAVITRILFNPGVTETTSQIITDIVSLAASDYLEIYIYHNDTVSRSVMAGSTLTFFAIHKLS